VEGRPIDDVVILRPSGAGEPLGQVAAYPSFPSAPRRPDRRVVVLTTVLGLLAGLLGGWLALQRNPDVVASLDVRVHDAAPFPRPGDDVVASLVPGVGATGPADDRGYVVAAALRAAGVPYERALRDTGTYLGRPADAGRLDVGQLDPAVAPARAPRTVLGLVASPVVRRVGPDGVRLAAVACGALALAVLLALAGRLVGATALVAVPVLVAGTRFGPQVLTGLHDEAALLLGTVLFLATLPLGDARRGWGHAVAAAGLVPVLLLSRPVVLLPVGAVLGGWLWASAGSRRLRNPWAPFVLTVLPATAASIAALWWWTPSDPRLLLTAPTGDDGAAGLSRLAGQLLRADLDRLLAADPGLLAVLAVGLAGLVATLRNPVAGVTLGVLGAGTAAGVLDGASDGLRCLAPALPLLLVLAALVVAAGVRALRRLAGRSLPRLAPPDGEWRPAALLRPYRAPARRFELDRAGPGPGLTAASAVGAWVAAIAVVAGTAAAHRPVPPARSASAPVSAARLGAAWPLTVPGGTLSCAGQDHQLWFVPADGRRYAVSGTALAATSTDPSVLELAVPDDRYGWPSLVPLLSEGLRICGAGRAFGQAPPAARAAAVKRA
jgi:hypothetical protein